MCRKHSSSSRKTVQRRAYDRKKPTRRSYDRLIAITPTEYTGLQKAYSHFNRVLFDRTLGDVFITYQRRAHSRGYFSGIGSQGGSMNSAGTSSRSTQTISTAAATRRSPRRSYMR